MNLAAIDIIGARHPPVSIQLGSCFPKCSALAALPHLLARLGCTRLAGLSGILREGKHQRQNGIRWWGQFGRVSRHGVTTFSDGKSLANKEERAARGLANFIRCHSRFRISRMEMVYSLPPHIYKRIGS